jgi:hypothetical protein
VAQWRRYRELRRKWDRKRYRTEAYRKKERIRTRQRRQDPQYRLNDAISAHIRLCLKGKKNGHSWEKLVGYSLTELRNHLEKQFSKGMTWDNYGKWHVDHIRPVSSFNFRTSNDEDFKICWALENLQPLWAVKNIQKHAQWDGQFNLTFQLGQEQARSA